MRAMEDAISTAAIKIEANIGQLSIMTKLDCINEIYSIISIEVMTARDKELKSMELQNLKEYNASRSKS